MIIRQLSVFIENKPGRLCAILDVLAAHSIDISSLSLADTAEFGLLRLIVDQPEKAKAVLGESGVTVRLSHVVALAMDDVPGGAGAILHLLSDNGVNIEYLYACTGRVTGKALMVIRPDDYNAAEALLQKSGYANIDPRDIYRINE